MRKNVIQIIHDAFKEFGTEIPNSSLIKEVCSEIERNNPGIPEYTIYEESLLKLRIDYGYSVPIEDKAERNDLAPFLSKTSYRGSRHERE